jgi:CheY-like chemotaxis protein
MSKILIIEDEAAIRRVLTKILSEENDTYQVEEAEDGVAGLKNKEQRLRFGFVRHQNGWC